MSRRRLTITIVGARSDKQNVRFGDFLSQLNHIKRALKEMEIGISGGNEASVDYKVVDLRHDSPATVVLEPVAANGVTDEALMARIVTVFAAELRQIKRDGSLAIEPDLERLSAYREIGATADSKVDTVTIRSGRQAITIDGLFKKKLEALIGPDEHAEGDISGMLDALNFHNTNKFYLYPAIGPKKITGTFAVGLRSLIKEAAGQYVTVTGRLKFKAWSPFPHGITARKIDIHDSEANLPTLTELRGAFAGVTGGLSSADFVDKLRDESW